MRDGSRDLRSFRVYAGRVIKEFPPVLFTRFESPVWRCSFVTITAITIVYDVRVYDCRNAKPRPRRANSSRVFRPFFSPFSWRKRYNTRSRNPIPNTSRSREYTMRTGVFGTTDGGTGTLIIACRGLGIMLNNIKRSFDFFFLKTCNRHVKINVRSFVARTSHFTTSAWGFCVQGRTTRRVSRVRAVTIA